MIDINLRTLLEYAKEGVIMKIGIHPCPNEWADLIEKYKKDLREIELLLKIISKP